MVMATEDMRRVAPMWLEFTEKVRETETRLFRFRSHVANPVIDPPNLHSSPRPTACPYPCGVGV